MLVIVVEMSGKDTGNSKNEDHNKKVVADQPEN